MPSIMILRAFVKAGKKTLAVSDRLKPATWRKTVFVSLCLLTGSIWGLIDVTEVDLPAKPLLSAHHQQVGLGTPTLQLEQRGLRTKPDRFADRSNRTKLHLANSPTHNLNDLEAANLDPETAELRRAFVAYAPEPGSARLYQPQLAVWFASESKTDREQDANPEQISVLAHEYAQLAPRNGNNATGAESLRLAVRWHLNLPNISENKAVVVPTRDLMFSAATRSKATGLAATRQMSSGVGISHNRALTSEHFVVEGNRDRLASIQGPAGLSNSKAQPENFAGFKLKDKPQTEEAIRNLVATTMEASQRSANPSERKASDKNSEILFWVFLLSTIVNLLGTISTIILAWVSNNRAKADLMLRQAEARLKTKETELRIKELEAQVARVERELSRSSSLIILGN